MTNIKKYDNAIEFLSTRTNENSVKATKRILNSLSDAHSEVDGKIIKSIFVELKDQLFNIVNVESGDYEYIVLWEYCYDEDFWLEYGIEDAHDFMTLIFN